LTQTLRDISIMLRVFSDINERTKPLFCSIKDDLANWLKIESFNLNCNHRRLPAVSEGDASLMIKEHKKLVLQMSNQYYNLDGYYLPLTLYILKDVKEYPFVRLRVFRVDSHCIKLVINYSKNELIRRLENSESLPRYVDKYICRSSHQVCSDNVDRYISDLPTAKIGSTSKRPYESQINLILHQHQRDNVEWMFEIEKKVDMDLNNLECRDFSEFNQLKIGDMTLYVDDDTRTIYTQDLVDSTNTNLIFTPMRGGVLCDEMGLGKTLSFTSLILRNPVHSLEKKKKISIKLKKNPQPETSGHENMTNVAGVLESPRIADKLDSVWNETELNEGLSDRDPLRKNTSWFKGCDMTTKATLICCPNRLCAQWCDEIKKYVGTDKLKVIMLGTKPHLEQIDYSDLVTADIVVVSFNFLGHRTYYQTQNRIKLEKVGWYRVIIDEGHETLLQNRKRIADSTVSNTIMSFKGNYKWVCTGTPFDRGSRNLKAILSYLSNQDYHDSPKVYERITKLIYDYIIDGYFRRNTRESIKTCLIPTVVEENVFLDFTPTERTIYDNAEGDDTRQMQLCTSILVSDEDSKIINHKIESMQHINERMCEYYQDELASAKDTLQRHRDRIPIIENETKFLIARCDDQIKSLKAKLSGMPQFVTNMTPTQRIEHQRLLDNLEEVTDNKKKSRNSCRARIKTQEDNIKRTEQLIMKIGSQIKQFRQLNVDTLRGQPCNICTSVYNTVAIFPCGHLMCERCTNLLYKRSHSSKCPFCREETVISAVSFAKLSESTEIDASESVNKWGTKMSYLINDLREAFKKPEERVIIFSQWKKMLQLVGDILEENGIQHVFCRGNIHSVTCSIRKFKYNKDCRVILLSSESCSSGSNLTEATRIYLLDTINSDAEHATAIENQAIGRVQRLGQTKNVKVIRLMMRDTIEERYYKRNQRQMELLT